MIFLGFCSYLINLKNKKLLGKGNWNLMIEDKFSFAMRDYSK